MKKNNITKMAIAAAALMTAFPAATTYAQKSTGWGDFKLFLDPGTPQLKTEACGAIPRRRRCLAWHSISRDI